MAESKNLTKSFEVGRDDVGRRLDRLVRKFLTDMPLGAIYRAIRRGDVRVNGKKRPGDYHVQDGDHLEIRSHLLQTEQSDTAAEHEAELPRWFAEAIVLETDNLLVLNKPQGVLVHGKNSLQTAVLDYLRDSQRESLSFTPGPLHRLDRNSSGLVLFGRSLAGASRFTALLRSHLVTKSYLVLLSGRLNRSESWEDRLRRDTEAKKTLPDSEGRHVVCQVSPLLHGTLGTLAVVSMQSGFTHQIRAQAAIHSHPLVGDKKYGGPPNRLFLLHAAVLELRESDQILGFRTLTAPLAVETVRRVEAIFGRERTAAALHSISIDFGG